MHDIKPCFIEVAIAEPKPAAVDMGAAFPVRLALTGASDIDLSEARCLVRDGEGLVWEGALPPIRRFDPDSDDYDPRNGPIEKRDCAHLTLTAPKSQGVFSWTVIVPTQVIGATRVQEAHATFSFTTGQHTTSLAVWDVESPVVNSATMRIKVGAKCTAGCNLAGQRVEIVNPDTGIVATGRLGEVPLAEAPDLYWAEMTIATPASCGLIQWSAHFAADDLELPHRGDDAEFSFMTVGLPQHKVSVTVIDNETQSPIAAAQVRLGDFRAATDTAGRATFEVPAGQQRLFVWEADYEIPERLIDVDQDLAISVAATPLPKKNPYERWDG